MTYSSKSERENENSTELENTGSHIDIRTHASIGHCSMSH